jgi:hypothetical protein
LLAEGWTDAMRKLHPDGALWTFWDYKFERWQKDKGMRLDHFLLSPNLSDRLVDRGVDRWASGQENASHHAPTWIMLDLQIRVEVPASVFLIARSPAENARGGALSWKWLTQRSLKVGLLPENIR